MSNIQIIKWDDFPTKQDWLNARRKVQGIGEVYTRLSSSDISVLTGSNPYKSKRRLFLSMTGLYNKDFISRIAVQGQVMEAKVQEYIESYNPENEDDTLNNLQNGTKLRALKQADFFLLNDKYPHLSTSIDFIPDGEIHSPFTGELYTPLTSFECKYINPMVYKEWDGEISQAYLEQCTLQAGLTETPLTVFNVLRWDFNFSMAEIPFDKDLFDYLVEVSGEFCRDVTYVKLLIEKRKLSEDPSEIEQLSYEIESLVPIDSHEDTLDVLNETHIGSIDSLIYQVENDSEENQLMKRYVEIQEQEKQLTYEKNETKSKLILASNEFEGIESGQFKAIIRGDNSAKSRYFRILTKKGDK